MNWMISMCVSLCLGSGLLLLEFYLSKKKAWQAGLVPILIVGVCRLRAGILHGTAI